MAKPKSGSPGKNVDLIFLVAVPAEEEALKKCANAYGNSFTLMRDQTLGEWFTIGRVGDFEAIALRSEMGAFGYGGAASRALRFQAATGATGFISIGMAFGLDPTKQKLGDVLVATSIFPYDRKRVYEPKKLWSLGRDWVDQSLPLNECGSAWSSCLFPFAEDFSETKRIPVRQELLAPLETGATSRGGGPDVHFGVFVSGGARVHSATFRRRLIQALPSFGEEFVVGGDMEAASLSILSPPDDPAFVVVKGVSDFADHTRDDVIGRSRPIACDNAVEFVFQALEQAAHDRAAEGDSDAKV